MDGGSQERFDGLRQAHYPAALNRIAAHLTLFHQLPDSAAVRAALSNEAAANTGFQMQVTGLMSLGRGVAYRVESPELMEIHQRLASVFGEHLNAQDRQRFRPHVVVQNKVGGEQARTLLDRLSAEFKPWTPFAEGLQWWDYLGGSWQARETFRF